MSGCRVGRVRMKNGGAELRLLPTAERGVLAREMAIAAGEMSTDGGVVAYSVMVLRPDGKLCSAFGFDASGCGPLNNRAAGAMFAERAREDFITDHAARAVFNRAIEGDE